MTGKPPYRKALLPLDLSGTSARIVDYSDLLKAMGVEEALLLHVLDESLVEHVIAGYDPQKLVEEHTREALKKLASVSERLEREGIKTRVLPVAKGHVAGEIAKAAREQWVDLIAMTDKGAGFFKLKLLGSTVEEVANTCTAPLLVVKTSFHERHVTRILAALALQDKELDNRILEHASTLALLNKARITLLNVVEEGDETAAQDTLGRMALALPSELEARIKTVRGRPYKVILREIEEEKPDLLVIGNDECMGRDPGGHSIWEGAVSDIILKRSPVHVLVVPKP